MKCIAEITKCKYSAKKNIKSIGPLYSVEYPATTSASVSEWSNGALFDSRNSIRIKPEAAGAYKNKYQQFDCIRTKSWKLADWELQTSNEYITVIKISNDITWTKPLTVPIIAYLDWLSKPTTEKKIFDSNIKIRWYKIIESTESIKSRLGPHTKFKENNNWAVNKNDKNIGAREVVGLGIIKISFVNILTRSAKTWNAPLRPIKVGPILLWANANNFRSDKTTKSVSKTTNNALNKIPSDILYF